MLPVYNVVMTNFAITRYTGNDLDEARSAAVKTGFECYIIQDGEIIQSYSPISGWRKYAVLN